MPKILASNLPSAAPRAGAAADLSSPLLSTSNKASRKDRAGGAFDDLLTGARKREAASQTKTDESQRNDSSRAKPTKESRNADDASDEQSPEDVRDVRESKATESKRSAGKTQKKTKDSQDQAADAADEASATEAQDAEAVDKSKAAATDDASTTDDAADDDSTEVAAHDKAKDAGDETVDGELDPAQLAVLLQHPSAAAEPGDVSAPCADGENVDGNSSTSTDPTGQLAAQLAHAGGNRVARPSAHAAATRAGAAAAANAAGPDAAAPKLGDAPAVKPAGTAAQAAANAASSVEALDGVESKATDSATSASASHATAPGATAGAAHALEAAIDQQASAQHAQAKPAAGAADHPQQQNVAPEVRFAEDNHDNIVSGVRGQLMPNGGTMRIRLDPPELGPLAVTVRLRNGVMEASFEASSDEAAKLLSHSLGSLKTSLESQGVNVERLHVQQAPKSEQASSQGDDRDGGGQQQGQQRDLQQEQQARQEHQRREMIRRMWRKLRGVDDPLDMVA